MNFVTGLEVRTHYFIPVYSGSETVMIENSFFLFFLQGNLVIKFGYPCIITAGPININAQTSE